MRAIFCVRVHVTAWGQKCGVEKEWQSRMLAHILKNRDKKNLSFPAAQLALKARYGEHTYSPCASRSASGCISIASVAFCMLHSAASRCTPLGKHTGSPREKANGHMSGAYSGLARRLYDALVIFVTMWLLHTRKRFDCETAHRSVQ